MPRPRGLRTAARSTGIGQPRPGAAGRRPGARPLPGAGESLRAIAARFFLGDENRDWAIGDFNGIRQPQAGQPLVVPPVPLNPLGVQGGQYQTVPILCYHRLGPGSGKMVVPAATFAAQLDYLAWHDYRVIRLTELAGFLEGRRPLPRRAVVLTFDDGYHSVYRYAWPLLKKHGFPATVFVHTDFVGAGDALSWAQMKEMAPRAWWSSRPILRPTAT